MSGLRWRRIVNGTYRCGSYQVGRIALTGEWFAEGPGVDEVHPSKAAAQEACATAAERQD